MKGTREAGSVRWSCRDGMVAAGGMMGGCMHAGWMDIYGYLVVEFEPSSWRETFEKLNSNSLLGGKPLKS